MEGFYYTNEGGKVNGLDQVVGELFLPAGSYIVLAKAHMAVASSPNYQPDTFSTAYRALLQFGGDEDEIIAGLKWDYDDPGSRHESVVLNVAAVTEKDSHARLLVSSTVDNKLLCFRPRISAFQLDALHISTSARESVKIPFDARIASASIMSGLPLDVVSRLFG